MTLDQWKAGAVGRGMNPDGVYGFQCVDVAKDYAMSIFPGIGWVESIGYGNAKDLYGNSNPKYFDKIANNPNDPNQLPAPGDIIVFSGWAANPYGHIAVIVAADAGRMTVIEQDGFNPNRPAYMTSRGWGVLPIIGWLRPKLTALLRPDQRQAAATVNYRSAPSPTASVLNAFEAGDVLDLKGFVYGTPVQGNNVWFVGKYSGGYLWSGAFTDASVVGLADLTPPPVTEAPNQRTVGADSVNYRKYPTTSSDILKSFAPGETLDFDAFTHGETINGNNIWFRGKYTGGWAWSEAFTNPTTGGLPEVPPPSLPDNPTQEPTEPVYSTRPAVPNTLWGVDVSSFQGEIDWNKLKDHIDFAIIRNGHVGLSYGGGENRTDTKFAQNKAGARQAGVPIAYYFYIFLEDDPLLEAHRFLAGTGDIQAGESLWLDMEVVEPSNIDKIEWARKFITEVERLANQPCHLYTYWSYANENPGLATYISGDRKLWLAHYDKAPGTDLSGQPLGRPIMHQYTSKGQLPGVVGNIDLNVFYGTLADFRSLGDKFVTVEPEDPDEPTPVDPKPDPKPNEPKPPVDDSLGKQLKEAIEALLQWLKQLFNRGKK